MEIGTIGANWTGLLAASPIVANGAGQPEKAASEFNSLLMEMLLRQSGLGKEFDSESSGVGTMIGDLFTQVMSRELAKQLPLVTAADLASAVQAKVEVEK
jgi:Rod binding domain-containing protein